MQTERCAYAMCARRARSTDTAPPSLPSPPPPQPPYHHHHHHRRHHDGRCRRRRYCTVGGGGGADGARRAWRVDVRGARLPDAAVGARDVPSIGPVVQWEPLRRRPVPFRFVFGRRRETAVRRLKTRSPPRRYFRHIFLIYYTYILLLHYTSILYNTTCTLCFTPLFLTHHKIHNKYRYYVPDT